MGVDSEDAERVLDRARGRYVADGFCLSQPLVDPGTVVKARRAAEAIVYGRYETGITPIYRNWAPGDQRRSLVKIDLPHLCNRTLQRLVSDHGIGAWVAALLQAKFVQVWACELLYKLPEPTPGPDQGVVGWHQDHHSFDHWAGEICTLWLALTDVGENDGPVRYVAGSYRWGLLEEARFFFQTDLDEQRNQIGTPVGKAWREVGATLPAGAASMHHRMTLHASGPNHSDTPRIGIAMHLRTERARLVPTSEPPFHTPDLADSYACPVLVGPASMRLTAEG